MHLQQRTELARILGVDSAAIKSRSTDWLRLMREMEVICIHITRNGTQQFQAAAEKQEQNTDPLPEQEQDSA